MTERSDTPEMGKLSIDRGFGYFTVSHVLPIEVRDSSMRLVKTLHHEHDLMLPAGLYEVSALLQDGKTHRTVVQVKNDETAMARFVSEENQAPQNAEDEIEYLAFSHHGAVASDTAFDSLLMGTPSEASPPEFDADGAAPSLGYENDLGMFIEAPESDVHFFDAIGAESLVARTKNYEFHSDFDHREVPGAQFLIEGRKQVISLPMSEGNNCIVQVENTGPETHIYAWMSPERREARALQNMLASGHILEAADVSVEAMELLRDKYNDPTAAALGALILLKTGRLQERINWVENLARDFDWLPDGKIILAHLLFEIGQDLGRVAELSIQASRKRPLFTESYSLLLGLLRRLPDELDPQGRQEALHNLAQFTPYIDWSSICLSYALPEKEGV